MITMIFTILAISVFNVFSTHFLDSLFLLDKWLIRLCLIPPFGIITLAILAILIFLGILYNIIIDIWND